MQHVQKITMNLLFAELIGRLVEVASEILHVHEIGFDGPGRAVRRCRFLMKRCRSGVMDASRVPEKAALADSCGKYGTRSAKATNPLQLLQPDRAG